MQEDLVVRRILRDERMKFAKKHLKRFWSDELGTVSVDDLLNLIRARLSGDPEFAKIVKRQQIRFQGYARDVAEGRVPGTRRSSTGPTSQEYLDGYDRIKWASDAPDSIEMKPYGGPGGGHHTPPKKAFAGAPGYDKNTALAIPNDVLKSLKIGHPKITGAQAKLYSAFSKLCKPLTWEVIEEIETKALIAGGADPGQALATVKKAIQSLKDAGVTGPTQIPWGR